MSPHVKISPPTAYANAGVNQVMADDFARRVCETTSVDGGFAATLSLPAGMREPVIVATCDGVGSKVQLLLEHGRAAVAGHDVVAMCVNDLTCRQAKPWFFLDYYGCAQLDLNCAEKVMGGIVSACKKAGCALVGGETAQLPDTLRADAVDLVGFCVGLAERSDVADASAVSVGDAIIGLLTEHLHCNGYSLVRKMLASGELTMEQPCQTTTVGELLLAPAPLYSDLPVLACQQGVGITASAHITGGGLPRNLARMLPPEYGVRLKQDSWKLPALHCLISEAGVGDKEIFEVFNHGIGMAWCVPAVQAKNVVQILAAAKQPAAIIGAVTDTPGIEFV